MKFRKLLIAFAVILCCSSKLCYAKRLAKPDHYFFLNSQYNEYNYKLYNEYFGPQAGKKLAVGNGALFYIFSQPMDHFEASLKKHFKMAEKYDIPVLIQLDPVTFWMDVPELWNWWNPKVSGYNPENKNNVEWYGWGDQYAVKIGWLNWGSQIRLDPMPNWFSPAYQNAVKERMSKFLKLTAAWYSSLPKNKKYLLGGVKITGELGFGINNWYYKNGNDFYDKPVSSDPSEGIDMKVMPSRGVGQIGYAALTYSGIKTSGEILPEDIYELEWRFARFIADAAQGYGIPRELLFTHAGGVGDDLAAAVQSNTCPSWSFYWDEAIDPAGTDSGKEKIFKYLEQSDAPYWGGAEWNIGDQPKTVWEKALKNFYSIKGCRFLSLYNYDTIFRKGKDGTLNPDQGAISALKEFN